jgi:hypothetical protein
VSEVQKYQGKWQAKGAPGANGNTKQAQKPQGEAGARRPREQPAVPSTAFEDTDMEDEPAPKAKAAASPAKKEEPVVVGGFKVAESSSALVKELTAAGFSMEAGTKVKAVAAAVAERLGESKEFRDFIAAAIRPALVSSGVVGAESDRIN